MEKFFILTLDGKDIIIVPEKNGSGKEKRIPISYFENDKYVDCDAFFSEIRNQIKKEYKLAVTEIRLNFTEKDRRRILDIVKKNGGW